MSSSFEGGGGELAPAGRGSNVAALGIDVGGTFTDAVLVAGGRLIRAKVPTTADQSEGVLESVRLVLTKAGIGAGDVTYFAHGMTTATNALLEKKGARTASVATAGFRDLLEIGRQNRQRLYDLCPQRPEPLVAREDRLTVRERISAEGIKEPLGGDEIELLLAGLRALAPEAVAVCLLFSFLDPSHELAVDDAINRELPGVHVSLSSSVLPQFREYERFSTTAVDAYLTPVVAHYLERLGSGARAARLPEPAIMQSSGGVLPLEEARRSAAPLLLSGPAAGVVGAIYAGRQAGTGDLIAFDMGGTSTDVSLIRNGRAGHTGEREVGGQPVALPMMDIHTIGAGGGSIAWIDSGGALRVGPESAGAHPGPACYGHGGREATVSDANLCLGYFGGRLGGSEGLVLRPELAEAAVTELARGLGASLEEAAMGIRQVAEAEMVKALRVISVERGHDPRSFMMVVFGGAGPMHAVSLAEALGMSEVLVPDSCGVLSALGMVVGDERRDWVKTVYSRGGWQTATLKAAFKELEEKRLSELQGLQIIRGADLRYEGQSHELSVEAPLPLDKSSLVRTFAAAHEQAYGYRIDAEVELVNIRLTAIRRQAPPAVGAAAGAAAPHESRRAWFGGWVEVPVFRREGLRAMGGDFVAGPLIVEDDEATTVVPPGWRTICDDNNNLRISK